MPAKSYTNRYLNQRINTLTKLGGPTGAAGTPGPA